jgi:hypothetical protein
LDNDKKYHPSPFSQEPLKINEKFIFSFFYFLFGLGFSTFLFGLGFSTFLFGLGVFYFLFGLGDFCV